MKRLDQLSLKQMRALHAVVSHRSIKAAAEALFLTPPAVHSQLKTLEESFGCAFIHREGPDAFTATPEGEALLTAFQETRSALARVVLQIDALKKGLSGNVILGVVSTGKYFAPGLVAQLRKALPQVEVILRIGNRQRILDALNARELDIVIMGRPPRQPEVTASVLGEHPHFLVGPPKHPLATKAHVTMQDLENEHFVMRESGSGTRILFSRYIDELGPGREVSATEMDSNETIKQAVISGLGLALLSGHTMVEELRTGRLVALRAPNMPIVRQWFILHRSDTRLTGAAQTVWDWIGTHSDLVLPKL